MIRFYPVGMPEAERREYDRYLDAIEEMKKKSAHIVTEIQAELLRKGYDTIYIARDVYERRVYIFVRACNRFMVSQTTILGYINPDSLDKYGVKHVVANIERVCGRR